MEAGVRLAATHVNSPDHPEELLLTFEDKAGPLHRIDVSAEDDIDEVLQALGGRLMRERLSAAIVVIITQ